MCPKALEEREGIVEVDLTSAYPIDLIEDIKADDWLTNNQIAEILRNTKPTFRGEVPVYTDLNKKLVRNIWEDTSDRIISSIDTPTEDELVEEDDSIASTPSEIVLSPEKLVMGDVSTPVIPAWVRSSDMTHEESTNPIEVAVLNSPTINEDLVENLTSNIPLQMWELEKEDEDEYILLPEVLLADDVAVTKVDRSFSPEFATIRNKKAGIIEEKDLRREENLNAKNAKKGKLSSQVRVKGQKFRKSA